MSTLKEITKITYKPTVQSLATIMWLMADNLATVKPEKPVLYVSPENYKLGLAEVGKDPCFYLKRNKLYFRGMKCIKFEPKHLI